MASTKVKIPTIDFSNAELKPNTPLWESTKIQVFEALQEYGVFEAIYDKVPNDIRKGLLDASIELFGFPLETKEKNVSEKPMHGFMGMSKLESLCIADLVNPQSIETFAKLFWPQGNPNFCNLVTSYSNPLVELDELVKRMILDNLGLKNRIDEFLDPNCLLRFIYYKGSAGHTDSTFLTIISAKEGLQINRNGEWFDVDISPNSYLVLSGDSMRAWTNGRLCSPVHKINMAGENERFSIQFFSIPKPGQFIEAPKELVDEKHPLLFNPYEVLGYYEYLTSPEGTAAGVNAMKTYCGA